MTNDSGYADDYANQLGGYNLFRTRCGSGYKPNKNIGDLTKVYKNRFLRINIENSYIKNISRFYNEENKALYADMYATVESRMCNGKFLVRGERYRYTKKHAWQVRSVSYYFIGDTEADIAAFKLIYSEHIRKI